MMRRFFIGNLVAVGLLGLRMLLLGMALVLRYLGGGDDAAPAAATA